MGIRRVIEAPELLSAWFYIVPRDWLACLVARKTGFNGVFRSVKWACNLERRFFDFFFKPCFKRKGKSGLANEERTKRDDEDFRESCSFVWPSKKIFRQAIMKWNGFTNMTLPWPLTLVQAMLKLMLFFSHQWWSHVTLTDSLLGYRAKPEARTYRYDAPTDLKGFRSN